MQVKMLMKGFQELGILEKGKWLEYNYLNPTAIGLARSPLDLLLNAGNRALLWDPSTNVTRSVSRIPGHSLGMDIHDSVTLNKDKPLEPGVVSIHFLFLPLSSCSIRVYYSALVINF